MHELRDIHKRGNTIIMVTHNSRLTSYADRIIYMLDGKISTDSKTTTKKPDLTAKVPLSAKRRKVASAKKKVAAKKTVKPKKHTVRKTKKKVKAS